MVEGDCAGEIQGFVWSYPFLHPPLLNSSSEIDCNAVIIVSWAECLGVKGRVIIHFSDPTINQL